MQSGPYQFHLVMYDCYERKHVHVYSGSKPGRNQAKIWLEPQVELAQSKGFQNHETRQILRKVEQNRAYLITLWNSICDEVK
jgi:hypothetical protein